jgi:hypothetical protein
LSEGDDLAFDVLAVASSDPGSDLTVVIQTYDEALASTALLEFLTAAARTRFVARILTRFRNPFLLNGRVLEDTVLKSRHLGEQSKLILQASGMRFHFCCPMTRIEI